MTAEESDDATAESGEDQDDDEFGSRLGDAYRETVGDGTRVDRSEESVDDAVEGASSLDGVGGGPDRVVSDRGVDDVLEEMGDDGESESAGTVTSEADRLEDDAPSDAEPTETSEMEADVEEEQVESEIDEEPSADDPDVESPDQTVEDDETDAEPEAEVEESVDSDGGDDVSTTPSEATDLADVSDSEAAVKRPADEVSQYEDDREDTSSIDDVELSMDDADDVSVPDRTPATSSGDAATEESSGADEETTTETDDANDATTDESDGDDESVGPLTRLVRWFGTLFGGS